MKRKVFQSIKILTLPLLALLFVFSLILLPRSIKAQSAPVLINDDIFDQVVDTVSKSKDTDLYPFVQENDILEYLEDREESLYVYGTNHQFSIDDRAVVFFEILPEGYDDRKLANKALSDVSLALITPLNEQYAVKAKSLLIVELYEAGDYSFKLVGSSQVPYELNLYRVKSPFLGKLFFVNGKLDFGRYKESMNVFVNSGGSIIAYNNKEIEDYLKIRSEKVFLNMDSEESSKKIDMIFDSYYKDNDTLTNLSSTVSEQVLLKYKNLDLALLFEGGGKAGNIIYLNPIVTTVEKQEFEEIMSSYISPSIESEEILTGGFNSVLAYILLGLLTLGVIVILFSRVIVSLVKDKNYSSRLVNSFRSRRKVSSYYYLINLLLLIFFVPLAVVGLYLYLGNMQGALPEDLSNMVESFLKFLSSLGIYSIREIVFLMIASFLIIDLSILFWLRYNSLLALRDILIEKFFIPLKEKPALKYLGKIIKYVVFLLLIVFSYLLAFDKAKDLYNLLVLVILILFILFMAMAFYERKRKSSKKWRLKLVEYLMLAIPIVLFAYTAYLFISPFGVERKYEFNSYQIMGLSESGISFDIDNSRVNSLEVSYSPDFNRNKIDATIDQRLKSTDEIYLTITNEADEKYRKEYLFFDEDLLNFGKKSQVENFFVFSREDISNIANINGVFDNYLSAGSLVGIDKSVVSSGVYSDEDKIELNNYYSEKDYGKGELNIDLNLYGGGVFYTYLNNSLDLELTYSDLNQNIGRDDFSIQILNDEEKVVATKYIEDDNSPLTDSSYYQKVRFGKNNISSGVYKIEICAFSITSDACELNSDLIFDSIKLNSSKLVLSTMDLENQAFADPVSLYFNPLDSEIVDSTESSPNGFEKYSCSVLGESFDGDISEFSYLSRNYNTFDISEQSLSKLDLVCSNSALNSRYTVYSLTEDSYFYPFNYYFSEIDKSDDVIITSSDVSVSEAEDGWYQASIGIPDMTFEFKVPAKFVFVKRNNNETVFSNYLIDYLKFEFSSKTK